MFQTPLQLLNKIRLGEDNSLELKSLRFKGEKIKGPGRSELADELAAMANTSDGICLLGVDDKSRTIEGIPLDKLEAVELYLREICNDSIEPPLLVRIHRLELPDALGERRAVIKVDVPKSLFVHRSPGGYFHRLGSSKRQLAPDALARLFQQRSQARIIRFDEQAIPDSSFASLKPELWRHYCEPNAEPAAAKLTLHKRGLLTFDEQQVERVTVSGALFCAPNPSLLLAGASARAVCFQGLNQDSNAQVDAKEMTGPIVQQILDLFAFAKRHNKVKVIAGPEPAEIPQFSSRALFEAIVNAVVHRDYSVYGSRVRLFIFDDRLELYSPGSLPNTLSVDSMPLRQSTRNETIKSIMVKYPVPGSAKDSGRGYFMEAQGDGVPVIIRETQALSDKPPIWRVLDDAELMLTIPAAG